MAGWWHAGEVVDFDDDADAGDGDDGAGGDVDDGDGGAGERAE